MYGVFAKNHRVGLVVLAGVTLASIFFSTVVLPRTVASSQSVYAPKTVVMQQFVLKTNELRRQYDLPELVPDAALETSAEAKLRDMSTQKYWGHYSPGGTSFSSFIWSQKDDAITVGENLARCFDSYDAAFAGLVASPTHFKVLTGDFSNIGVASEITPGGCESIVMHVSN
jgi:uncharacterized protein YkwD